MLNAPSGPRFRFGAFEFDAEAGELRKRGIHIRLQAKPLQILAALLERPGEVVSREELRRRLWPSDEFGEFDQNLNTAVKKLRQALGDSPATPFYLETHARLGYRFIAPVRQIHPVEDPPISAAPPESSTAPAQRSWKWLLLLAAGLATGLALFVAMRYSSPGLRRAKSASVLVLPFESLTPIAGRESLADGLTDELITQLAQVHALRVISRTSSMKYKGTRVPVPVIARELKVDAVVEGTLRSEGTRLRINVKLIHASSESNLWAQTYERDLHDAGPVESEIAGAISRNIQLMLTSKELAPLSGLELFSDQSRSAPEPPPRHDILPSL